ncbi:hypothetical protein [Haloferax sulfurifontis]|uniref:Uncharacterized protein n=1 Tax=Haloferax sulfurifontis TaxID=255616 RepID=A0A830DYU0_9EURY|nr:hypothetical protein [Haloferax sulfurifontis]GGC72473.1 hypothetical protein GCM10007209_38010 [Haloferax sulfurifontis]
MSDDNSAVAAAKSMLAGYGDLTVEEKHGAIQHAIAELENARRALPEDY